MLNLHHRETIYVVAHVSAKGNIQLKGEIFNFEALPLQYAFPCHLYEELFEKLRFDPHYFDT